MSARTRIGIVGYGNLGRGVERAIGLTDDLELIAVHTRRPPESLTPVGEATRVLGMDALEHMHDQIDVLILCGGSKDDLPRQTPELARHFNVVDSYDNHARIPEHFSAVDAAARAGGRTAVMAAGWDPGLFSLNRLYGEAILPEGSSYTFWGKGLSQGHSDALRRVPGVAQGVQYTIPSQAAIEQVRSGAQPRLSVRDQHTRECFVVLEEGASESAVRTAIVTMPDYFEPYDTTVHFISAESFAHDHGAMPHGGFVIRSGQTRPGVHQVIEYHLQLDSNPEFTASVLVACARAAARMNAAGQIGAQTVFDIAPALLSPRSPETLRAALL